MPSAILATYLIESTEVARAAEMIAGEQSSGTFVALPGETEQLRSRSRAKLLSIEKLGEVASPSLPGARYTKASAQTSGPLEQTRTIERAKIQIAFPYENMGSNLPMLMATVCGNLFELAELSGCKLLDLEIPEEFASRYPGPQFGVVGTRQRTGIYDRPVLGTIIKPSVGLTIEQTAELVRELCAAGIDFIKDDELMANPPDSPIERRVEAVMREIDRAAQKSGRKVMYACNISDEMDAMRRHHDCVMKAGGNCVMVSVNHVGLAGVSALRAHCQLPIHGHRNGWGMFTRHPALGIEFAAYQKLWRAVGVDHLHVNGIKNKFWESDDSVVASVAAMRQRMWGGYHAMPVISSGQWGGQAPETFQRIKTQDVIYLAGGGIIAHPSGPAAGVRAIQQAWEAAVQGISLDVHAKNHPELKQSIEKFSK